MMSFVYLCVDCGRPIVLGKNLYEGSDGSARCKDCITNGWLLIHGTTADCLEGCQMVSPALETSLFKSISRS